MTLFWHTLAITAGIGVGLCVILMALLLVLKAGQKMFAEPDEEPSKPISWN